MGMYGPVEFGDREDNPEPMPISGPWDGSDTAFQIVRNGDGRTLYNIDDNNAVHVNGDPFHDDSSINLPLS